MTELGQILPDSNLGQTLTRLSKDAETIVETGTWNGRGSTQCLRLGLVRPTQRIWTVEANEERHLSAKEFHADEPRITCLLGTIVTGVEILPAVSGVNISDFTSEVAQNNTSPLVFDQLPAAIDLFFCDGGAFSGFAEVKKLKERCNVIVLDDVNDSKNSRSFDMLSENWRLLEVHGDRYGWAVFKRK